MSTMPMLLTPDQFEKMSGYDDFELVDGVPKERNGGCEVACICSEIVFCLAEFVKPAGLGHILGLRAGFICFPHRPSLVRKPNVSFVAKGRFEGNRLPRGCARLAPDLAVEVVSPDDHYEVIAERVDDYLKAGVRLIWVVSPLTRTVLIYSGSSTVTRLTDSDELTGDPVLPGFRVRVADLFPPPLPANA